MALRRLSAAAWVTWVAFVLGVVGEVAVPFLFLNPTSPLPPFARFAQADRFDLELTCTQLGLCAILGFVAFTRIVEGGAPSAAARRPSLRERLRLEWVRPYEFGAYLAVFPLPLLSLAILLLVPPGYDRAMLLFNLVMIDLALQTVALMSVVADGRSWLSLVALARGSPASEEDCTGSCTCAERRSRRRAVWICASRLQAVCRVSPSRAGGCAASLRWPRHCQEVAMSK